MLVLFHGAASFFVFRSAKSLNMRDAKAAATAYLLNPFILIMAGIDGHMDSIMMLFFIGSVAFLLNKRYYPAFFMLTMSMLTKYFPIIFVPFYWVYVAKNSKEPREAAKIIFWSIPVMVGTAVLVYWPYWEGFRIFSEVSVAFTDFYTSSFPYISYNIVNLVFDELSTGTFKMMSFSMLVIL